MNARDAILDRVRQALKRPAPQPHWAEQPTEPGPTFPLPPGDDEAALRERFRREFEAIQGEYHEVGSLDEARTFVRDWLNRNEIVSALAPRAAPLPPLEGIELIRWIETDANETSDWENADVGFTVAESLVAESGTIVVSAASAGRAISVLPPIHFVFAEADQLVPDLETSMRRLRERYPVLPSSLSWISGPSRTADIEKILVLGAHGPRRLIMLLLPAGGLSTLE